MAVAQEALPAELGPASGATLSQHEIEALRGPAGAPGAVPVTSEEAETPRRFNYTLSVSVRGVYDDNIFVSSFNRQSDFYFSIEPIITIGLGGDSSQGASGLSLTYRPGLFLFIDHSDENTIQHLIRLQGLHNFGRLTVSLSQDVQILDGADLNSLSDPTGHNANIDVSQRTKHNIFATLVSDTYDLTGKLFLSNSFGLTIDDYESSFIGSQNISGNLFLNYNYSEKLVIGLGGTGGYNTVDEGSPDQTYEQANLRISYGATGKISLSGSVGAEFRQFANDSSGSHISPVFELNASYKPFDGTSISLSGDRRIQNSASLSGQDYTTTNFHLTLNQRFLRRFALGLAVGYERSQYFSTIQGLTATRDDDYYYVQPTVDATIMRWWTAGLYYTYRKSSSSLAFFGFDDNQFGLRTMITF
jgi:hypothetical protein